MWRTWCQWQMNLAKTVAWWHDSNKDWPLSKVRNKALTALKEHGVRITSICGDAQAALAFLAPKIPTHLEHFWTKKVVKWCHLWPFMTEYDHLWPTDSCRTFHKFCARYRPRSLARFWTPRHWTRRRSSLPMWSCWVAKPQKPRDASSSAKPGVALKR